MQTSLDALVVLEIYKYEVSESIMQDSQREGEYAPLSSLIAIKVCHPSDWTSGSSNVGSERSGAVAIRATIAISSCGASQN